ncbi:MAG TPA: hypothetical protein VLM75_04875 [Spirochaetota bacterium]|nr:hypothetical protein [Spirochaetota bacterium]
MKLSLLLFILYRKLKKAVKTNKAYRSHIGTVRLKILIKTVDGKRGRLFVFDRGTLSSRTGGEHSADAALVWSDAATAFRVMASGSDEESFKAAALGGLKVEGMAYYIQWFTDGIKLVMK